MIVRKVVCFIAGHREEYIGYNKMWCNRCGIERKSDPNRVGDIYVDPYENISPYWVKRLYEESERERKRNRERFL